MTDKAVQALKEFDDGWSVGDLIYWSSSNEQTIRKALKLLALCEAGELAAVPVEPKILQLEEMHDGPLLAYGEVMGQEQIDWLTDMYKAAIAGAPSLDELLKE